MNNLDNILGTAIPMLLSGSDVTSVIRQLTGIGGVASYDGLQQMVMQHYIAMNKAMPAQHSAEMIQQHASGLLSTLGINPYTGAGQGIAMNMVHAYRFAPDIVGAMIGLPNAQSLYQQMANGASGINIASGRGAVDIFNPYSAQAAYQNSIRMADMVARFASPDNHGFDIGYTHGLNMEEVGKVSQRLLSSGIPYRTDDGNRLDTASKEFEDRLKKLGEKFNSTVSTLTKLTGSVDESIRVMDQLAGGNFLGGSESQAMETARRARNLASTIRVTSAMAGTDPREAYRNMMATQQGLVMRSGLDQTLADASGYSGVLAHQAANATISYNMWAAQNPNASQQERNRAMIASQARTMQYVGTSGEAVAAIVSAHKNLFSNEELESMRAAYRRGDPDAIREMVQERIGYQAYADYMNDPAAIMSFRAGGDQEFQKRMADAAAYGNEMVATFEGGRRRMLNNFDRTDSELATATGDYRLRSKDRRNAATNALIDLAVRDFGLTENEARGKDLEWLQNYLNESGADTRIVEMTRNSAEIESQIGDIRSSTMSPDEEKAAKGRLSAFIDTLGVSNAEKARIKGQVNAKDANLNAIYGKLVNRFDLKYDTSVLGGKLSQAEADRMISGFGEDVNLWSVNAGRDELRLAVNGMAGISSMLGTMTLSSIVGNETFKSKDTSDQDALKMYDERVQALRKEGKLPAETAERSAEIRREAISNVVKNALELDEKGKNTASILSEVGSVVDLSLKGGHSLQESIRDALTTQLSRDDLTKDERARLKQLYDQSGKEDSSLIKDKFNRTTVVAEETTIRNREAAEQMKSASEDLFKTLDSEDKDAGANFLDAVGRMSGVFGEEAVAGIDKESLNTKSGRMAALQKLVPDFLDYRVDAMASALGTTNKDHKAAALAFTVSMAKKMGLSHQEALTLAKEQGERLGLNGDELANAVGVIDDTYANKSANALTNAINYGSGGFADTEIKRGKEHAERLQKLVTGGKITRDDLENLNNQEDEDVRNKAREKVRKELGNEIKDEKELEYSVNFAAGFSGSSFGKGKDKKSGVDILADKEAKIGELDKDDMLGATKQAYQKDSAAYDILSVVSSILETLTQMFGMMRGLQGVVQNANGMLV